MTAVALLCGLAYGCDVFLGALAAICCWPALGMTVMPACVSYAVYYYTPPCAIGVAMVLGVATDVLAGTALGSSVAAFLCLWFVAAFGANWLPRARGGLLWGHMAVVSLVHRLLMTALLTLQGEASWGSLSINMLWSPLVEASLGLWLVRRAHSLLARFGQKRALVNTLFPAQP